MKNSLFTLILVLVTVAVLGRDPVGAQQAGNIHLLGVSRSCIVYMDGKEVTLRDDVIATTPGWHEVQVEAMGNEVVAVRRWVEVLPGQTQDLPIGNDLLPVIATGKAVHRAGGPGPTGPTSPVGPEEKPLNRNDMTTLRAPLMDALEIRLHQVSAAVDQSLQRIRSDANGIPQGDEAFYWYDPDHRTTYSDAPGPATSVGPVGEPVVCEANRILDENGKPVLDEIERRVKLKDIENAAAHPNEPAFNLLGGDPPQPRLKILTPRFRDALDKAKAAARQAGTEHFLTIAGAAGLSFGECGLDVDTREYRLTQDEVEQLVQWASASPDVRRQIEGLQLRLADIELWKADIEQQARVHPATH